jgi:choline dehydrogenase-like flavoprotein
LAKNEVIISAGAIDTPKILLLSGIGPKEELATHGIEPFQNLPGVGKNLQDHPFVSIVAQIPDGSRDVELFGHPKELEAAKEQFVQNGTGPYADMNQSYGIAYMRPSTELLSHPAFKALPAEEQAWIRAPTVAAGEIILNGPVFQPPQQSWIALYGFLMVEQSRGTVKLRSADPAAAPVIDPNFFSNEFDKVNLVSTVRLMMEIFDKSPLKDQIIDRTQMPKSKSDEDIWAYLEQYTGSIWHMTGTAKMGKADDELAVVDSQFRVRGVEGLRVADMSVVPFVPNAHTQAWAYLAGETLAEKLTEQYGLGS